MQKYEVPFQLVNTSEAAKIIGVSSRTLEGWRSGKGEGPRYKKLSVRCVRYPLSELMAFAESNLLKSKEEILV